METSMTKDYLDLYKKIEDTILDIINRSKGVRATELAMRTLTEITPRSYRSHEFTTILFSLRDRGLIIEMTYKMVSTGDRIHSMYFPKGTSFEFGGV